MMRGRGKVTPIHGACLRGGVADTWARRDGGLVCRPGLAGAAGAAGGPAGPAIIRMPVLRPTGTRCKQGRGGSWWGVRASGEPPHGAP